MLNEYRRTKKTVSFIHYHFVFCPRYRRKIFLNSQVEERFKKLVQEICEELEIEVIAMECDKDHVHLFLNILPTFSPIDISIIICRMRKSFGKHKEEMCMSNKKKEEPLEDPLAWLEEEDSFGLDQVKLFH